MSETEKPISRDKERTRRLLIEAASRVISERGAGVSLADIAAEAGVSKGALTHHFPSRDDLEAAILIDGTQRFADMVHAYVDLSENRPGKLLRGYVRALTGSSAIAREFYSPNSLLATLGSSERTKALLEQDADLWRSAFESDGVDLPTSLMVRYAAEGLAIVMDSPYLTDDELKAARTRLLELAVPSKVD